MNYALILAGGTGTRVGADRPKQYIEIGGKPIMAYCVETLCKHEAIDGIQIVADIAWRDYIVEKIINNLAKNVQDTDRVKNIFKGFSNPGVNRQMSILNGLEDIFKYAKKEDNVIIHDAARPMLTDKMINDSLTAIKGHDGVLPVIPMKDTVYLSEDGKVVSSLIDRSKVYAGQAPETFVVGKYYEANKSLLPDRILDINGSTEPAILAGMDVVMIPGDEGNYKVTTVNDLEKFKLQIIGGNV